MAVEVRELKRDELELFQKMDRSEKVTESYRYVDGRIELYQGGFEIDVFPPGDKERIQQEFYNIHDKGGKVLGAFLEGQFVGIVAVENHFIGSQKNKLNLEDFFVTEGFRGKGIGRALMKAARETAKEMGAEILYISATASKNTVDFYMSCGAELSTEVDPVIYAKADDDIHLELKLLP